MFILSSNFSILKILLIATTTVILVRITNAAQRNQKHLARSMDSTFVDFWSRNDKKKDNGNIITEKLRKTTPTTMMTSTILTTDAATNVTNYQLINKIPKKKIEVVAFCNDPGRPPKSQISPVQLTYLDGDQVVYNCDQFISLKQYRKCLKGKWHGDIPLCGEAFRDNDLVHVLIYKAENGFPNRLLAEYNLTNQLQPFNKFGNSFIAERYIHPVRASNSTDYYWNLILARPALIQMIRLSFSIINHLTDPKLTTNRFDVITVATNQHRECVRVANHSVSPWHYNSTRFDYWYFCRAKSEMDLTKEISKMTNVIRVETTSEMMIQYDLATFILAEQYSNNGNFSHPICGFPEVPVGLESRVINDQTNYVFTCAKDFQPIDNLSGQFQVLQCGYDNRWHGTLPKCYPLRTCYKFKLINDEDHNYLIEVYKYDRVYYVNETEWIPISGSRAFFRCKDETNIFVGKEIRICDDGEWTNSLPNCLPTTVVKSEGDSFRTSSILMIVMTTLIFTFLLSSCTIYFFLKFRNQMNQNNQQSPNIMLPGMELSDSGHRYYSAAVKEIDDDVYEVVDNDTRYISYDDNHILDTKLIGQLYEYPISTDRTPDHYYDDSNVRQYLSMNLTR